MQQRGQWDSRLGFILAAAGSAVGLGNIWKFPYITGMNGGGVFVLVYLLCIALVGIPILSAEILIGRAAASSPVGAFRALGGKGSPWAAVGLLGVVTAGVILSYYSVVAGWCLDYVFLSLTSTFSSSDTDAIPGLFGKLHADSLRNLVWHVVFVVATVWVVLGGVRGGVERAARVLMPALFVMLLVLLVQAATLPGFGAGFRFVFQPDLGKLNGAGVLEALGHSFFTLSVGMGAMLTYGSYLSKRESVVESSIAIGVIDTAIALIACLILFPITFSFGMEPASGPGLVFMNMPVAFAQLPFGAFFATLFFLLLFVAAWTSGISLLEVLAAYCIDEWGIGRRSAALLAGGVILILGIPSALSGADGFFGSGLEAATGRSWFDWFDHAASNWFLPIGGLGIASFTAWRLDGQLREIAFTDGSPFAKRAGVYRTWLFLLRYLAPIGIAAVFLHGVGWI
jgi:NSS family neurotransmitter:Na+ symporter